MAGLALADGGVQSANTVGFLEQTVNTDTGSANIGVCFGVVGNPSASFTVTSNAFGTVINEWEQFYAFDANNWDLTSYTYQGASDGWGIRYADGTEEASASLSIAPGTSLYYFGANATFKTVGEVAASGTHTITFDPESASAFDFVNPFPVATTFGDLETFVRAWDQFYVFDPANWDLESYTYQGAGEGWGVRYADGQETVISTPSTVFLAAGQGATYLPGASVTWTKTLNY